MVFVSITTVDAAATAGAVLGMAVATAAVVPLVNLGFRTRLDFGSNATSPQSVVSGAALAPLFAIIIMLVFGK